MNFTKALVTGGAGFLGSHLVDRLMLAGCNVTVLDNLSTGSLNNIRRWLGNERFRFVKGDLKNMLDMEEALENVEVVFHFAANPEVRVGETDPSVHFNENLVATFNVLEAMRKSVLAKTLVFASTSTVYGDVTVMPTPENYGPLVPISTYGASKLGCEALAFSYAYTFDIRALILRIANVVGFRSNHGVIVDFIRKLKADPKQLQILGDGTQKKSYLHVEDCIDAVLHATKCFLEEQKKAEVYNVGSADQIEVGRIAEIV
ncbi:MAG: NAD-dependent epimerase/dehydratase family protein, partial [Candidatus Bathyarchaeia archaeon]